MLLFLKENTPKKVIRDTCPSITYYFAKYHRLLIWLLIKIFFILLITVSDMNNHVAPRPF